MNQSPEKSTLITRLLQNAQKFLRTDINYLVKSGSWIALGNGFQTFAGLLLAIAFANLVTPEIYGTYKYVISIAGIAGAFTLSNMGTAITQAVARGYEGSFRAGFKQVFKWSIGIVLFALIVGIYYYLKGNTTLALGMLFVALSYPVLHSAILYRNYLDGKKDFKRRALYLIIWETIEVGAMVITIFRTHDIILILAVFFITNALPPLFFYFRTLSLYHPNEKKDPGTSTYGKHLSVIYLLHMFGNNIDKLLIFHFLGPVELAVYSFAILPVDKVNGSLPILQVIALPKFSNTDKDTLKKTLPRKVLIFSFIMTITFFVAIAIIPFVYHFIFSQYANSIVYAQVYALMLLTVPAILFGQALTAQVQTKALYHINISTNVVKIIALLALLPFYGLWGAIIALLLTRFLQAILQIFYFYKM
jgi:O-antigen/teichoic acid export membrane protein